MVDTVGMADTQTCKPVADTAVAADTAPAAPAADKTAPLAYSKVTLGLPHTTTDRADTA